MRFEAASAALAVVLAGPAGVRGAPPDQDAAADVMTVDVVGACPDRATVMRLLAELLSPEQQQREPTSIQDRGLHYRIAVGDRATTFDDPARDCTARARAAAVVVASELQVHPLVVGPPMWTIEKGAVFEVAPGTHGPAWAPGVEFRAALGSGTWSLVGAAGARGPATLSFAGGLKAELLRFPLDAGAGDADGAAAAPAGRDRSPR